MKMKSKLLCGLGMLALCIPLFTITAAQQDDPEYAGNDMCLECHDEMAATMAKTIHGKLGEHEIDLENSCESCHGPAMKHVESEGETPPPYVFKDNKEQDVEKTCVSCHVGGATMGWHFSEHASSGITCLECHKAKEPYEKLGKYEVNKLCQSCHSASGGKFNLPSHHPLPEHKMSCMDCHNPHGAEESMIKAESVTDLCYSCHRDKQGPFMYEHEPVVENCLLCHDAKGAVNNNLLVANETSLCLRCHAGHEDVHPDLSSATSRAGYMNKCTRCHSQIHGSDLPGFAGPSRFIR